jgi:hypothetical protein
MAKFRYGGLCAAACVALLALGACGRQGQDEMSWARAALERNADLEVIAADPQSHTFTVRLKGTGELRMVRADQVVASGVPAAGQVTAATPQPPPSTATTAPAPAPAPAATEAAASETAVPERAEAPSTQPSSLLPQTAVAAEAAAGQVLESGPGYTIKTAAAVASTPGARARDSSITSAAVEHRHEPIVCQGSRLLHIDNRNLVFDGDAVSAEDGCEIHITNSHISAAGVGVLARAANVHIDNSLIEGDQASIDLSEGAQVYTASSRFRGLSRRLDTATVHDLGGNVWN